jgi:hypothetical protein
MVLLSRLDCVDVLGVEDGIEADGELGVRVSDEESERQADRVQVEEVDGKEIGTRFIASPASRPGGGWRRFR